MKYVETLISAILSGICIGIGGTVYLVSGCTLAGAVLFSIGLLIVCTFNLDLYTGQISYILQGDRNSVASILIVLIGNLAGAWMMAQIVKLADIVSAITYGTIVSQNKLDHGLRTMFFLAILCNIMIYIAVEGYRSINNSVGKYLILIVAITVFVYCGFEHSIADMFYYSLAGFTRRAILALLVIIPGNAAGGILTHNIYVLTDRHVKEGT